MESISPVYTEELVGCETVIALDQPEYRPIIGLFVGGVVKSCLVRFEFTPEERKLVAEGADLVVAELIGNRQFTPIGIEVVPKNTKPDMMDIEIRR